MRINSQILIIFSVLLLISFSSCKKVTEDFKTETISDIVPLAVGKYITYRLDSTVFTNLGRNEETHRYQVKHIVDAQVTDNLGRPGFRILRFLRDLVGTQPWVPNGTYFIIPFADQVEVVEDNLRFIKLHLPFTINSKWKGNKYLSDDPYASIYTFSNDDNMNDWDYKIDQFDVSTSIGAQPVSNVYTVFQIDESINAPVTDIRSYGARTLSKEKYSKSIGLVSRDYIIWEYQPNISGSGGGYKIGFGIKMWMIDHN